MVGIRLIIIMAIIGGLIAYMADKMGSKIGKKKMSVFGLRPKHTSILLTTLAGTLIAVLTIVVMAFASNSARTALFGLDKIQSELRQLNAEKLAAGEALSRAKRKVEDQNQQILELDAKIKENLAENDELDLRLRQLNSSYEQAKSEVNSLTAAKDQLSAEVEQLESITDRLRKGITTMREGQLFYRAGELVHTGVMRGGLDHENNAAQVNWLLQNANSNALQRLGVTANEDKPLQAIWIANQVVDDAVAVLDKSRGNMLFRVRTVANIFVGEMVVCEIEIVENQFIYPSGELIYKEEFHNVEPGTYDNLLLSFLVQVNHRAVEAGVLPDPLTGKVGNMDAATMIDATNAMARSKGNFLLKAYTKGDVTTAGPLKIRLEVKELHE